MEKEYNSLVSKNRLDREYISKKYNVLILLHEFLK